VIILKKAHVIINWSFALWIF